MNDLQRLKLMLPSGENTQPILDAITVKGGTPASKKVGDLVTSINNDLYGVNELLGAYNNTFDVTINAPHGAKKGDRVLVDNNVATIFSTGSVYSPSISYVEAGSSIFNLATTSIKGISAIRGSNDTILVAYWGSQTNNPTRALKGFIKAIKYNDIDRVPSLTISAEHTYYDDQSSIQRHHVMKNLKDGRAIIVYVFYNAGTYELHAKFIDYNGSTVPTSTGDVVVVVAQMGAEFDVSVLDENNVIVVYNNAGTLNIVHLGISGDIIAVGTPTAIGTNSGYITVSKITNTRAIIGYKNTSNTYQVLSLISIVNSTIALLDTITAYAGSCSQVSSFHPVGSTGTDFIGFVQRTSTYLYYAIGNINNDLISLPTLTSVNVYGGTIGRITALDGGNLINFVSRYSSTAYFNRVAINPFNYSYVTYNVFNKTSVYAGDLVSIFDNQFIVFVTDYSGSGYNYYYHLYLTEYPNAIALQDVNGTGTIKVLKIHN